MQEEIVGMSSVGGKTLFFTKNNCYIDPDWNIIIGHGFNKTNTEEKMEEQKVGKDYSGYWVTKTQTILSDNPMVPLRYHQVKIDRVTNGFIIKIGCKKFVCEKWDVLAKRLAEYWADPVAAKKKYCEKK